MALGMSQSKPPPPPVGAWKLSKQTKLLSNESSRHLLRRLRSLIIFGGAIKPANEALMRLLGPVQAGGEAAQEPIDPDPRPVSLNGQ